MNHKRLHLPMELITDSHSQEQKANQWLDFLMENCLTARQKQILVLYYYEKQTLREIADQLGITESTACRTKNRACRRLSHYAYPNSIRKELSNHEAPDL